MALSLYEISIPVFIRNIKTLQKLLDKAVAHASNSSKAVTEEALLESRLIPDMYNLTEQSPPSILLLFNSSLTLPSPASLRHLQRRRRPRG
jgi:hypothetical protein